MGQIPKVPLSVDLTDVEISSRLESEGMLTPLVLNQQLIIAQCRN